MGSNFACFKGSKEPEVNTVTDDCEIKESALPPTRTPDFEPVFTRPSNCEEEFNELMKSAPISSEAIKVWR